MDDRSYRFLRAVLGQDGAKALVKAAVRVPTLEPALLPRAVLAWLGVYARTDYEGSVPGQENSYLQFQKSESGYHGTVAIDNRLYSFSSASLLHMGAAMAVALGADHMVPDHTLKEMDLRRLGQNIDTLAKAFVVANELHDRPALAKAVAVGLQVPNRGAGVTALRATPTTPEEQRNKRIVSTKTNAVGLPDSTYDYSDFHNQDSHQYGPLTIRTIQSNGPLMGLIVRMGPHEMSDNVVKKTGDSSGHYEETPDMPLSVRQAMQAASQAHMRTYGYNLGAVFENGPKPLMQSEHSHGVTFSHEHHDLGEGDILTHVKALDPNGQVLAEAMYSHSPTGPLVQETSKVPAGAENLSAGLQSHAESVSGKKLPLVLGKASLGMGAGAKGHKEGPGPAAPPQAPLGATSPLPPDPTQDSKGPTVSLRPKAPKTPQPKTADDTIRAGPGAAAPKAPKMKTPGPSQNAALKVTKSQATATCPACGGRQFESDSFTGCLCFRDLAKSTTVRNTSKGYNIEFGSEWDKDSILTLIESFGREDDRG